MGSIRQERIESTIQKAVATHLQRNAKDICLGAMVTVTAVRVTPDLSLAKVYISIFSPKDDQKTVLKNINDNSGKIRFDVGKELSNLRKIPDLRFYVDDSLDYAMEIDQLLKKK